MVKGFEVVNEEAAHGKAQRERERGSRKVETARAQRVAKLRGWPGPGSHGGHTRSSSFFLRAVGDTAGF